MKSTLPALVVVAVGAVVATTPACGSLALGDRPCPCAAGWTCCEGANVCVAEAAQCSSLSNGGAASAAGASKLADAQTPQCMTQDADHVYWMNQDNRLAAVAKSGGQVVFSRFETAPQPPLDNHTDGLHELCGLGVHGRYLYATMRGLGKIAKVSLETNGTWDFGAEGYLFGSLSSPSSLAVDDTYVYATEFDTGLIKKFAHGSDAESSDAGNGGPDGGTGTTASVAPSDAIILAQNVASTPELLVADESSLYWVDGSGLRRMAKTGGTIATLLTDASGLALAVTASTAYGIGISVWSVPSGGGPTQDMLSPASPAIADAIARGDGNAEATALEFCVSGAGAVGVAQAADYPPVTQLEASALTADAREIYYAAPTTIYRAAAGQNTSTAAFTYRGACDDYGTRAKLLLVDDSRVIWADQTSIWSHPR